MRNFKKHFIFALIIAAVSVCSGHAQTTGYTVTGTVLEKDGSHEAVVLATVRLTATADSTRKYLKATDEDGHFTISGVAEGRYRLGISCMGYDAYSRDINVSGDTDAGIISLKMSGKVLDEVTVLARFSKLKPTGETVVQVKGNPLIKGKSMSNFLRFLPNLDVTSQNLSINGRNNTLIYLEDRPISYDDLKAISPDMISHIEIQPQAEAKYGANATGGVVRVYLRKDGGMLGTVSTYEQIDDHGILQNSPRLNILYTKEKVSFYNNARTGNGKWRIKSSREYMSDTEHTTDTTSAVNRQKWINDNFGLIYRFSDKDRLNLYGGFGYTDTDYRQRTRGTGSSLDYNSDGRSWSWNAGMQLKKSLGKNKNNNINIKAEYEGSNEKSASDYLLNPVSTASYKARMSIFSLEPHANFFFSNNTAQLSAGLMYAYLMDKHNNKGFDNNDVKYISDDVYNISTTDYEAWTEFTKFFKNNFTIRMSLKYHGNKHKHRDLLNSGNCFKVYQDGFYPTLYLQWVKDYDKNQWGSLSYRRYYSLPNYNYYSPVVTYQSANQYSIGNPGLTQELFDDVALHISLSNKISINLSSVYRDNLITVQMRQDAAQPGVYYTKPENSGYQMTNRLILRYTGRLFKWWYTNNSLRIVYLREKTGNGKQCFTSVYFNSNNQFDITKNAGIFLNISCSSPSKTSVMKTRSTYNITPGGYASLLKDKLSIEISGANLFYNHSKATMRGEGWKVKNFTLTPQNRLMLTVRYSFSAGRKIKKIDTPTIEKTDRQTPSL